MNLGQPRVEQREERALRNPGYSGIPNEKKPQRGGRTEGSSIMPQSLAKVIVHIVYSTKSREPWLEDKTIRGEWLRYPGLRHARSSRGFTLG